MKKLSKISLLVSAALALSCTKNNEVAPSSVKAGYFILSQPASNARVANTAAETIEFDLGDIRASKSFGFTIANGGENEIKNITLAIDNALFNISPTNINSLKAKSVGLSQIVGLDVIHGRAINGSALSAMQPAGENMATLTISGNTTDEAGKELLVSAIAKFKMAAKIMDIALFEGDKDVTTSARTGECSACIYGNNAYAFTTLTDKLTLKNTGNVAIKVNYSLPNGNVLTQTTNLAIGASFDFDVATPFLPIKIELDGSNTVGDQKKMNLGTNGNGYIAVYSRDGQYLGDSFTVKTDTAKVKRNQ